MSGPVGRVVPALPVSGPEPASAPAPAGYPRSLATAVEVAEHETRIAAEELERYADRVQNAMGRTLRDLRIERTSPFDAEHGVRVSGSDGLGTSAEDYARALATYIAKRDGLATLRRLLAEANAHEAAVAGLVEASREAVIQTDKPTRSDG